ncbi:MAG: TrkH family potassium uptake protein, partial [Bacilli bacterium]|nr:TrkH family potassium uptake protein [Bacilli bacterium]
TTNSPHIFIFYRSICHFFGGVGLVLVASSAISDAQGMKLYSAEGHTDKLLPNLKKSARLILTIYAGYIVAGALGLWLFGMDWFDALQHSVGALATGGFSSRSTSLYYFLNPVNIENHETVYSSLSSGFAFSELSGFNGIMPINPLGMEITTLILMFLGATSFMLHVEIFTRKWKQFFRDVEVRVVIAVLAIFIPMMMLGAWSYQRSAGIENGFWYYLRSSIFQCTACLTTTGFSNVPDINALGPAVLFLSVIAMTIGGGMGSTAGGLKQYRVAICAKEINWKFKYRNTSSRFVLPRPIYRFGDLRQLEPGESKDAVLYTLLYLCVVLLGATLIAFLPNIAFDSAIYEAASAISSAGNSMVNFSFGSLSYKVNNPSYAYQILLSVCIIWMFFGRLEIVPILNAFNGAARRIAGKDLERN